MLLRQVKANTNLPNIVFVLLFQPSIVERALDPVADGDGRAFLEKVVQASFDLPAVPVSVVHRMFGQELSALAEPYATDVNGFTQTRWGNAFVGCIQPLLRNMRDARRLISSIAVHMPLHVAGDVFEVNIIDFVLLESLRVFEPDLHEALFRERSWFSRNDAIKVMAGGMRTRQRPSSFWKSCQRSAASSLGMRSRSYSRLSNGHTAARITLMGSIPVG